MMSQRRFWMRLQEDGFFPRMKPICEGGVCVCVCVRLPRNKLSSSESFTLARGGELPSGRTIKQ